ncbi:uncharacterized protein [Atheta coriaria]|uniref:uncharacterized protein isoform X2 n=1 Tax=Dalotia coriaria TaxID=877792 RepID=UPI0031F33B2D
MRYLWCVSLLLVCGVLHAEAVTVDNPSGATGSKAGRHRHLQHFARPFRGDDLSPTDGYEHRSGNKLRHHASTSANNQFKPHADAATRPNFKINSSFSKADKFPKLKQLGKRLETLRSPTTSTTTTDRNPYFFAARTKDRPRWKYVHDYDEEYDAEEDDADTDDAYVDEVARTTEVATKSSRIITKASHSASYEDETVDENTNDDYYDDEIFAEDTLRPQHDVQAEEGQHEQSPMTQYKWKNYGTRQALEESQRSSDYGNNDRKNVRAANEHFLHMKSAAKCRLPRPRVINVQEIHQLPGKAFRPHCTVLHRCGDDTGCCQGPGKKCRAKSQEVIYLPFYVYSTTFSQSQAVERLAFHNHTECACLDEEEMKLAQRLIRPRAQLSRNSLQQDKPSCTCPEEFISSMNHRFGRCACDCPSGSDSLSGCANMKRGKEHLSLRDRKCILEERCAPPTCEYGTYAKQKGRCPRRQEVPAGTYNNALGSRSDSDNDDDSIED